MNVHVLLHVQLLYHDFVMVPVCVHDLHAIYYPVCCAIVMEEELKTALDRCKELEQSSVPAVDGVDIFYLKQVIKWQGFI